MMPPSLRVRAVIGALLAAAVPAGFAGAATCLVADPDPGARDVIGDRWQETASAPPGADGDPVILTWSIPPDLTPLEAVGSVVGPGQVSTLRGTLTTAFGDSSWMDVIREVLDDLAHDAGVTFVEDVDDGAEVSPDVAGELGVRGDLRLTVTTMSGPGGAAGLFPENGGDLYLDEGLTFFHPATDHRPLRAVLYHELGHALGLRHSYPDRAHERVMEPTLNDRVLGMQDDDLRGLHRLYGDRTGVAVTPIPPGPLTTVGRLSLHRAGDRDWFELPTFGGPTEVRVRVVPEGVRLTVTDPWRSSSPAVFHDGLVYVRERRHVQQGRTSELVIYDAGDPRQLDPVARLPLDPANDYDAPLAVDGGRLALPGWPLQLLDVTDPYNPRLAATIELGWTGGAVAAISGATLFVLDDRRLHVVDVTDLDAPAILATRSFSGSLTPRDVVIQDGIGYFLFEERLYTADVSDSGDIDFLDSRGLGGAKAIAVADGVAYVPAGDGVRLLLVSDPSDIGLGPVFAYGEPAHGVAIDRARARLYVLQREELVVLDHWVGEELARYPTGTGSAGHERHLEVDDTIAVISTIARVSTLDLRIPSPTSRRRLWSSDTPDTRRIQDLFVEVRGPGGHALLARADRTGLGNPEETTWMPAPPEATIRVGSGTSSHDVQRYRLEVETRPAAPSRMGAVVATGTGIRVVPIADGPHTLIAYDVLGRRIAAVPIAARAGDAVLVPVAALGGQVSSSEVLLIEVVDAAGRRLGRTRVPRLR